MEKSFDKIRLGGIANCLRDEIEKRTQIECRATILGHVQRGGTPTPSDRVLATRFGAEAINLVLKRRFGRMVAYRGGKTTSVSIKNAVGKLKLVPRDSGLVRSLRAMGISFGD